MQPRSYQPPQTAARLSSVADVEARITAVNEPKSLQG
jgi:hypothetical protein